MLYMWDLIVSIVTGAKDQTRRIWRPGDTLTIEYPGVKVVRNEKGYIRWRQGGVYSVQPGRGKPAVYAGYVAASWQVFTKEQTEIAGTAANIWRGSGAIKPLKIRITDIGLHEDVRDMDYVTASHEGFYSDEKAFLLAWAKLNDGRKDHQKLDWVAARPGRNYKAWVLYFELAGEYKWKSSGLRNSGESQTTS